MVKELSGEEQIIETPEPEKEPVVITEEDLRKHGWSPDETTMTEEDLRRYGIKPPTEKG